MKNKKRMLFFLLLVTGVLKAQEVSNIGTLYVSPNTVVGIVPDFDNQDSGTFWNDGDVTIWSNFNNNGLVSYTPNLSEKGFTRFVGSSNQSITGSETAEFQDVLFNNSSAQPAIELHSEISIAGNANFNRGIIDSDTFGGTMVFERLATQTNASNDSHVDGKVKKNGDAAFRFPVGHKGEHREAGIEATDDVLGSFSSKFFYENSGDLFPHTSKSKEIELINDQEYWEFDKNSGTADAMITLSWDEDSTTPSNIVVAPYESIHIVRWDDATNSWIDKGGVVDSDNKTVTTPVAVSGYSIFTLARVMDALPCKDLVIYNAVSPDGDGKNDYFRIDGLDSCTDGSNNVQIFNRWGVKVFEADNYGQNGNVFNGYSNGRTTISGDKSLPSGTYFYIINMNYIGTGNTSGNFSKSGYLYLN